jgi:hypothetical protein
VPSLNPVHEAVDAAEAVSSQVLPSPMEEAAKMTEAVG